MLQVARLAPKLLGESTELVRAFLASQQNSDGGFKDRSGDSDLYYTVFGIEGLLALQAPLPEERIARYLESFGAGEALDFVHLCCLVRCWAAALGHGKIGERGVDWGNRVASRLETFRSGDGGFSVIAGSSFGTAYGGFLGAAAYQDLGQPLPEALRLVQSLKFLETPDGAWGNERGLKVGATNTTAAMVTLLLRLGMPVAPAVGDWLLKASHRDGGFLAAPNAPIPDLLSTATALHALAGLERDFSQLKEGWSTSPVPSTPPAARDWAR